MIAIDTNIIIYTLVQSQPEHIRALRWMQNQKEELATTPTNIGETLRLLTHPKVFPKPLSLKSAVQHLGKLIDAFGINILSEPDDWWQTLTQLSKHTIAGNDVFDARIVCTLQFHGIKKICTMDPGFEIYSAVEVISI